MKNGNKSQDGHNNIDTTDLQQKLKQRKQKQTMKTRDFFLTNIMSVL